MTLKFNQEDYSLQFYDLYRQNGYDKRNLLKIIATFAMKYCNVK